MNKKLFASLGLVLVGCGPDPVRLAQEAGVQAGHGAVTQGYSALEAGHQALGQGYQAVGDMANAQAAIAQSNTAALQLAAESIDATMRAAGWVFWSSTMTNILLFVVMVAFVALAGAFVWWLFRNVVAPMAAANAQLTGRREYDRLEPPDVLLGKPLRSLDRRRNADLVERRGRK